MNMKQFYIDWLWPCDATQWCRSWSTMVMVCCLTKPSHSHNQCWFLFNASVATHHKMHWKVILTFSGTKEDSSTAITEELLYPSLWLNHQLYSFHAKDTDQWRCCSVPGPGLPTKLQQGHHGHWHPGNNRVYNKGGITVLTTLEIIRIILP